MESVFGINMVALRDGQPRLLTLKECWTPLSAIAARLSPAVTIYELRKARERGHVLEGQAVALANIDPGHRD